MKFFNRNVVLFCIAPSLAILLAADSAMAQDSGSSAGATLIGFIAGMAIGAGILFLVHARQKKTIQQLDAHVLSLARGNVDLSRKSGISGTGPAASLAQNIDRFTKTVNDLLLSVQGHASTVLCSAGNMRELAAGVLEKCEATQGNTSNLSDESGRVGDNMNSVSAAVDQANTNIELVAAASEEMHSTISEIAKNMEDARAVTREAVGISSTVTRSMDDLDQAARQITSITDAISEISEQTNLLALNATIESARAGEAGKGFAVVANEIKSLAEQTGSATLKIKEMVQGISSLTSASGKHIHEITGIIQSMDETVNSIAAAMEQQSSATREISENAHQASQGIAEIHSSMADTSGEVTQMNDHIQGICNDAEGIGLSIFESRINAEETHAVSDILLSTSNKFKLIPPKFDIGNVKLAHMGWRTTLEAVIAGHKQMQPDQVVAHTDCAFGKWYFNDGKAFASYDLYEEIGIHHEQVHKQAMEVIRRHNAGDQEGAGAEMKKFLDAKTNMFEALDRLYLL